MKDILFNFENYLKENPIKVDSFHPFYEKALNEMILAGGKRFRPALLLSVVNSFDENLVEKSFPVALAIEMMHTYSLIHDDLPEMDNSSLRRGHTTLHVTYDHATATLVGDALNTHAFESIANCDFSDSVKINLVKELALNAGSSGMVLGQAIDIEFENKKLNLEQIKFLHQNKTGKIIAGALKMGIICVSEGNRRDGMDDELYDFGLDLGLLFQIQDDILDVISDSSIEGKSVGKDENKNTFVNLFGLDGAIEYANDMANTCEERLGEFEIHLQENLRELLSKYLYRHRV